MDQFIDELIQFMQHTGYHVSCEWDGRRVLYFFCGGLFWVNEQESLSVSTSEFLTEDELRHRLVYHYSLHPEDKEMDEAFIREKKEVSV